MSIEWLRHRTLLLRRLSHVCKLLSPRVWHHRHISLSFADRFWRACYFLTCEILERCKSWIGKTQPWDSSSWSIPSMSGSLDVPFDLVSRTCHNMIYRHSIMNLSKFLLEFRLFVLNLVVVVRKNWHTDLCFGEHSTFALACRAIASRKTLSWVKMKCWTYWKALSYAFSRSCLDNCLFLQQWCWKCNLTSFRNHCERQFLSGLSFFRVV